MWWQEMGHPSVKETGVPPPLGSATCMAPVTATSEVSTTATAMPEVQGVSAGVSTRRGSQGWCSSADDADKHQGTGSFSQPPPPPVDLVPTTKLVSLPPGFQSLLAPRIPTTHSLASAQSTARCVFVRTTLSRVTEKMTTTVSTPGSQSCLPRQADMLLSSLTFTQIGNRPEFLEQLSHRSPSPALGPDQRSRRQSDKFQVLSWNPGPARGKYPRALTAHLHGPWHIICIQEGAGFVTGSSLAENIHVATQHHCAVLLNKDTFCARLNVHRAPDPSCSYFTVANIHVNNECAKRRSICIALLLLIRDLCLKLGAVILTVFFTMAPSAKQRQTDLLTIAAPVSLKLHSATPTSHGLLPALRRCGAQAVSSMAVRGPNAVGSWSCPSHRVTGFSCVMVRLMSTRRSSA